MTEIYEQIKLNYRLTLEQIRNLCEKNQRDPESVKLVVVTKRQPVDKMKAVIEAGAKYLGENYAEEAVEKMQLLSDYRNVEWHIIGHVQSRKAGLVAEHFNMIHSLDSLKLTIKLNVRLSELGKTLPTLLEVNIAGEESKSGWSVTEDEDRKQFRLSINEIQKYNSLEIKGLMTMPPLSADPDETRRYFRKTKMLLSDLNEIYGTHWTELSMGTSSDFSTAIEEGATIVRIGQAIMGPRI
jgi:pyridoxal phosphate enzyme (YggS family)